MAVSAGFRAPPREARRQLAQVHTLASGPIGLALLIAVILLALTAPLSCRRGALDATQVDAGPNEPPSGALAGHRPTGP